MSSLAKMVSLLCQATVVSVEEVVEVEEEYPIPAITVIVHPSDEENLTCQCVAESLTCLPEEEMAR
jgi:hypothetical protein